MIVFVTTLDEIEGETEALFDKGEPLDDAADDGGTLEDDETMLDVDMAEEVPMDPLGDEVTVSVMVDVSQGVFVDETGGV